MKIAYFIRTFFISVEFLIIAVSVYLYFNYEIDIVKFSKSLKINEEIGKYFIMLPLGLAVWIFLETKKIVFDNSAFSKLLVSWPEYWKLKMHLQVTLIYAALFSFISIIPWLTKEGVESGFGLLLFSCGLTGQLVVSASLFFAGFAIQERAANL